MNSPFTGGSTILKKEISSFEYRKDSFDILYHYYLCLDTKEKFSTKELDTLNLTQVHNKYREKYGIPFTDEIKNIRERYGLSASKMSEVLGLGANIYRNYEAGEMPSVSTGRLIRLAQDAEEFHRLLEMSKNVLEPQEFEKVKSKIAQSKHHTGNFERLWESILFFDVSPCISNGYRVPSLERVGSMVKFFAKMNKPFTTALNKLMFYSDFGHFKKYGQSISGLYYKALPKGPVPENYGSIYNSIVNTGYVRVEEEDFIDFVGERFVVFGIQDSDLGDSVFNEIELQTMMLVSEKFKGKTTKQIVDISHEEPAWKDNVDNFHRISFEYGFSLRNFE